MARQLSQQVREGPPVYEVLPATIGAQTLLSFLLLELWVSLSRLVCASRVVRWKAVLPFGAVHCQSAVFLVLVSLWSSLPPIS